MRVQLDLSLASGYKSPSQKARRVTEGWFDQNMYCLACTGLHLDKTRNNYSVVDFICPSCGAEYQVKARRGRIGGKMRDAAYEPMMSRVMKNRSPHFAFLEYENIDWHVRNLLLVPGYFITPSTIERCRPLSASARRAGWVGCNILTQAIPPDGRVFVITDGVPQDPSEVRKKWKRFTWLANKSPVVRGWTADVLRCVRSFGCREFSLAEAYSFEDELEAQYPKNHNIRAKIRQQLQVLRDHGIVRFVGSGRYMATEEAKWETNDA